MSRLRRSKKSRPVASAKSLPDASCPPARPTPTSPGAATHNGTRADREEAAAHSLRKLSEVRIPLTVAAIGAAAGIVTAGLNGMFGLASTHSSQLPSSTLASESAKPRASSPTPIASTTQLPADPLMQGDNSAFIADVNYPDGTKLPEGQLFIKKWEIKNIGRIPWIGRYLEPDGKITGACTYPSLVPVPTTYPGKPAIISVPVVASIVPQVCYVTWKMVNSIGDLYFPNEEGIWFNVTIVAPSHR
jgi:hypothetical protein